MNKKLSKIISIFLCLCFLSQQIGFAQVAAELDLSAHFTRLHNSISVDKFRPLHLRYLSYDNLNNNFKLLLDKGTDLEKGIGTGKGKEEQEDALKVKTKELLNYFFVGISLPNDSFWVNLRPDSPDNVIDPYLAQTDVGKILLEADLQLKKDTSTATSPQTIEGKEYWGKLYKKAEELFGIESITIPTLTRPWIVPGEIIIRESTDNAYIYKATLKVMLEQDYLAQGKGISTGTGTGIDYSFKDERLKKLNEYSTQLIRETIIPKLTKDVNTAKRYAPLRQVYYSLILAQWFKQKFYAQDGLYSHLIDQRNLTDLGSKQPWDKQTYFKAYQTSFQKGEYNLKEPVYTPQGQVIRSYMSGGMNFGDTLASSSIVGTARVLPKNLINKAISVSGSMDAFSINNPEITASAPASKIPEPAASPVEQGTKIIKSMSVALATFITTGLIRVEALAQQITIPKPGLWGSFDTMNNLSREDQSLIVYGVLFGATVLPTIIWFIYSQLIRPYLEKNSLRDFEKGLFEINNISLAHDGIRIKTDKGTIHLSKYEITIYSNRGRRISKVYSKLSGEQNKEDRIFFREQILDKIEGYIVQSQNTEGREQFWSQYITLFSDTYYDAAGKKDAERRKRIAKSLEAFYDNDIRKIKEIFPEWSYQGIIINDSSIDKINPRDVFIYYLYREPKALEVILVNKIEFLEDSLIERAVEGLLIRIIPQLKDGFIYGEERLDKDIILAKLKSERRFRIPGYFEEYISLLQAYVNQQAPSFQEDKYEIKETQAKSWSYDKTERENIDELLSKGRDGRGFSGHLAMHQTKIWELFEAILTAGYIIPADIFETLNEKNQFQQMLREGKVRSLIATDFVHFSIDKRIGYLNSRYAFVYPLEMFLENQAFILDPLSVDDWAVGGFSANPEHESHKIPVRNAIILAPKSEQENIEKLLSNLEQGYPGWQRPKRIFYYEGQFAEDGLKELQEKYNLKQPLERVAISRAPKIIRKLQEGKFKCDLIGRKSISLLSIKDVLDINGIIKYHDVTHLRRLQEVQDFSKQLEELSERVLSSMSIGDIEVKDTGSSKRGTYQERDSSFPDDFDLMVNLSGAVLTDPQLEEFGKKLADELQAKNWLMTIYGESEFRVVPESFISHRDGRSLVKIKVFRGNEQNIPVLLIDVNFFSDSGGADGIRYQQKFWKNLDKILSGLPEKNREEGKQHILAIIRSLKAIFKNNGVYGWVEGGLRGVGTEQLPLQLNGVEDEFGTPKNTAFVSVDDFKKIYSISNALFILEEAMFNGQKYSSLEGFRKNLPLWDPGSLSPTRLTNRVNEMALRRLIDITTEAKNSLGNIVEIATVSTAASPVQQQSAPELKIVDLEDFVPFSAGSQGKIYSDKQGYYILKVFTIPEIKDEHVREAHRIITGLQKSLKEEYRGPVKFVVPELVQIEGGGLGFLARQINGRSLANVIDKMAPSDVFGFSEPERCASDLESMAFEFLNFVDKKTGMADRQSRNGIESLDNFIVPIKFLRVDEVKPEYYGQSIPIVNIDPINMYLVMEGMAERDIRDKLSQLAAKNITQVESIFTDAVKDWRMFLRVERRLLRAYGGIPSDARVVLLEAGDALLEKKTVRFDLIGFWHPQVTVIIKNQNNNAWGEKLRVNLDNLSFVDKASLLFTNKDKLPELLLRHVINQEFAQGQILNVASQKNDLPASSPTSEDKSAASPADKKSTSSPVKTVEIDENVIKNYGLELETGVVTADNTLHVEVVLDKKNLFPRYMRVGKIIIIDEGLNLSRIPNELLDQYIVIQVKTDDHLRFFNHAIPFIAAMLNEYSEGGIKGVIVEDDGIGAGIMGLIALKLGATRVVGIEWLSDELNKAQKLFEQNNYTVKRFKLSDLAEAGYNIPRGVDKENAQVFLFEGNLLGWNKIPRSMRENIVGGSPKLLLADLGPDYAVYNQWLDNILTEYKLTEYKNKIILGGFRVFNPKGSLPMKVILDPGFGTTKDKLNEYKMRYRESTYDPGEGSGFYALTVQPEASSAAMSNMDTQIRLYRTYSANDILEPLKLNKDDVYVDLAGGPGTVSAAAASMAGRVIYVDISEKNIPLVKGIINYAKNPSVLEALKEKPLLNVKTYLEKLKNENYEIIPATNVEILLADAQKLPLADNSVSKLSVTDLFYWISQRGGKEGVDNVIKEMLRVTKSGGLLHIKYDFPSQSKEFIEYFKQLAQNLGIEVIIIEDTVIGGTVLEVKNKTSVSSPLISDKGGIDLRALPIMTQPINPGTISLQAPGSRLQAPIPLAELQDEWQKIENMLAVGLTPSSERIKEYLQSCCQKQDYNQEIDKVLSCIADILRLEEEQVASTDSALKEVLVLLESDKPVEQMQLTLAQITVEPKEPKTIE
ncbi:MAG: methyltransferase domain-containing protein [Candidatus Omnitrophota bacterium]